MLGKYRPLKSASDLCRAIDILEHKRFFLPSVASLNDPLEGRGLRIRLSGYAGMSIAINAGELPGPIKASLNRFGVLCLTSDCKNPQMWAHYADGFQGMCICVKQSGCFSEAQQVNYQETAINPDTNKCVDKLIDLDTEVAKSLTIKQSGWSYENEYRIIVNRGRSTCPIYYQFEESDFGAVILGHRANSEASALIRETCERLDIPLYKTFIHELDNKVVIIPLDFELYHNGATLDEQLSNYFAQSSMRPFSKIEFE